MALQTIHLGSTKDPWQCLSLVALMPLGVEEVKEENGGIRWQMRLARQRRLILRALRCLALIQA